MCWSRPTPDPPRTECRSSPHTTTKSSRMFSYLLFVWRHRSSSALRWSSLLILSICLSTWTMDASQAFSSSNASTKRLVRPSRLEDKPRIEELLRHSYKTLLSKDYNDGDMLERALPKITGVRDELLTSGTWYVVEDVLDSSTTESSKNVIIGCGGWTLKSPMGSDASPPHLRHFATHPNYLRQGVAKSLWHKIHKEVCDCFGVEKAPTMDVYSTLTAESFYASLGFQPVERLTLPLGDDCDFPCILMRRLSDGVVGLVGTES